MISYAPFRETLKEKGIKAVVLRRAGIHPASLKRIADNQPVDIETIEAICLELDVPIEKVVRILPNPSE